MGGGWVVKSLKSPVNVEICDDKRTKVVHTNRLRHRYVPGTSDTATQANQTEDDVGNDWTPPAIEHLVLPPPEISQESAHDNTLKDTRQPERYRP